MFDKNSSFSNLYLLENIDKYRIDIPFVRYERSNYKSFNTIPEIL